MFHTKSILSVGLVLLLAACSTVEGFKSDVGRLFSSGSEPSGEVMQVPQPMTVEEAMGDMHTNVPAAVATPPVTDMSYDRIASQVSTPGVELFSLDSPGMPVRATGGVMSNPLTPMPGMPPLMQPPSMGLQGVASSTDPSVTVFPFTEDMYTPGVNARAYAGVKPQRMPGYQDAELLPMYTGNPNVIYFAHGSSALNATARQAIASAAKSFEGMIAVEAHASHRAQAKDPVERAKINYRMSMKRAMAVTKALISQGVPAEKIKTTALGDTKPAVEEVDRASEAKNRRVEILTGP